MKNLFALFVPRAAVWLLALSTLGPLGPLSASAQTPLGTEFSYQGSLELSGAPVTGTADFQVKLFGAVSGGVQVGSTQAINAVSVGDGVFVVSLDFGVSAFTGDKRWLEIAVRSPAGSGSFVTLTPRQPLTAAPYALKTRGVDGHSLDASDGSPTDALLVGATGDVGIGTTSPAVSVHVQKPEPVMVLQDTDAAAVQSGYFGFWNSAGTETGWVGFGTPGNPDFSAVNARTGGDMQLYAGPGGTVSMITGGQERLTVASNGGVGVGTTTPSVSVHVNANEPVLVLQDPGTASTQSGYIGFWNATPSETAWVGFGTPGSPHFSVVNARAGGNIVLDPGANGVVSVPVLEITGADLAERFPSTDKVEPGMVVALDPDNRGQICLARGAYNRRVAGVVSGANDFAAGAVLGNLPGHEDAPPIALSGRVYVHCDAASGAIEVGDLLTTSDTAGYAMKASDRERAHGAVIGKAMENLSEGRGLVLVLVNLQ